MRRRIALISVASWCCLSSLAARALEPLPAAEIRQNLFSTCAAGEKESWIVGELGRVFRTTDGGKTFLRATTGTKAALLSVACLPDGTVIVVGQHGLAIRSRDGGASWENLTTGTSRNLLSVTFAAPEVGIAVGDYGTILRTEDGGTTWTAIPPPKEIPLPEDIAEIIQPGDVLLYDVAFPTPRQGWIVGEFGVIFRTVDAGQTWTPQPSSTDTTLFGVASTDADHGWAVGIEGVMLRTVDGGSTWHRQQIPMRKGFVLSLYDVAVEGDTGWAIGDSGLVLRSVDGGESWTQVVLPIELAANWFRGLSLTSKAQGLIVGSEGMMLVTNGDQYRNLKRRL